MCGIFESSLPFSMKLTQSQEAVAAAIRALPAGSVLIVASKHTVPRVRMGVTTALLHTLADRNVEYLAPTRRQALAAIATLWRSVLASDVICESRSEMRTRYVLPGGRHVSWQAGVLGERGEPRGTDQAIDAVVVDGVVLKHAMEQLLPILAASHTTQFVVVTTFKERTELDWLAHVPDIVLHTTTPEDNS